MKKTIGIYLFFFSFNVFAMDSSVFSEYPSFQEYQETVFNEVRNYFEVLPTKSISYTTADATRIFKILKNNNQTTTIYSKIVRNISPNQIIERVTYSLENSTTFSYEVKKIGAAILPSADLDLLNFRFNQTPADETYQLSIPSLNILMIHSSLADGEKNFLNLGFMEFIVQTESHFKEHEASLNYIYFFKGMPRPQIILSVKAIEAQNEWNGTNYIHAADSSVITPKLFFDGLNDGSGAFSEASNILLRLLIEQGFPNFN